MNALAQTKYISEEEYWALDEAAERKHEYFDGEVFAMAGVICPPPIFDPNNANTLLNPRVIFEVLSPSTGTYDRTGKFDHYKAIESLTDYVLVDQDWVRVEHFNRLTDGAWALRTYTRREEILTFPELDLALPLAEFYERLELPEDLTPVTRDFF